MAEGSGAGPSFGSADPSVLIGLCKRHNENIGVILQQLGKDDGTEVTISNNRKKLNPLFRANFQHIWNIIHTFF
jgi:hypothetical protein